MAFSSSTKAGPAIGAMFFAIFGAIWLLVWCVQTYGAEPGIMGFIILCAAGVFLPALRKLRKAQKEGFEKKEVVFGKKPWQVFFIVNAIQWVSIIVGAGLLNFLGYPDWIVPSIILIVGLHFFPLAAAFKAPSLNISGVAMVIWAIGYPLGLTDGPESPTGCLGAGLILLISGIFALIAKFPSGQGK